MKHKKDASLGESISSLARNLSAGDLRAIFARMNPHVPLHAYDNLLLQYAPAPLAPVEETSMKLSPRKREGDEMYETFPSTDIKFLLPGDSVVVHSYKNFPEQFEFIMHYIDKSTGELKSVIAPHQAQLRTHLSVSKPSGPLRASVSGPYNQITFTAPTSKTTLSGFVGSYFRKAGVLDAIEIPINTSLPVSLSVNPSPVSTPVPSNVLKSYVSAPTTPISASPRNSLTVSTSTSSDIESSALGLEARIFTSMASQTSVERKVMPVALSFRTKLLVEGAETFPTSPLFIICDSISQVDLFVCKVFRAAFPNSYPFPSIPATNAPTSATVPNSTPLTTAKSTPSTATIKSTKKSSIELKKEKERTEKAEKADKESKERSERLDRAKSTSPPRTLSKPETSSTSSKSKKDSSSKSKASSKTVPTAQLPSALPAPCKTEIAPLETGRFAALKFW